MTVVLEQGAAPSEVIRYQPGRKTRIGLKPRSLAVIRIDQSRIQHGIAISVETDWVKGRIGQPEGELLGQEGVRDLRPKLGVVAPMQIVEVGLQTEIGQLPGLAKRAWLVRKRIAAGIIVDQILTHERIHRQRGGGIEYVDPTGGDAEGSHHLFFDPTRSPADRWYSESATNSERPVCSDRTYSKYPVDSPTVRTRSCCSPRHGRDRIPGYPGNGPSGTRSRQRTGPISLRQDRCRLSG